MLIRMNINEDLLEQYPNAVQILQLDCRCRNQLVLSLIEEGLKRFGVVPGDKKTSEALLFLLDAVKEEASSNKGNTVSLYNGNKGIKQKSKGNKPKQSNKEKSITNDLLKQEEIPNPIGISKPLESEINNNDSYNSETEIVATEVNTPMSDAELFASLGIDMSGVV